MTAWNPWDAAASSGIHVEANLLPAGVNGVHALDAGTEAVVLSVALPTAHHAASALTELLTRRAMGPGASAAEVDAATTVQMRDYRPGHSRAILGLAR